jgi:hypothetical protein
MKIGPKNSPAGSAASWRALLAGRIGLFPALKNAAERTRVRYSAQALAVFAWGLVVEAPTKAGRTENVEGAESGKHLRSGAGKPIDMSSLWRKG